MGCIVHDDIKNVQVKRKNGIIAMSVTIIDGYVVMIIG